MITPGKDAPPPDLKIVSINKIFASEVNKLFLFTKNENENLEFVSQIKHHLEYINKEFK